MAQASHEISPPERMFQMITGYWVTQLVGTLADLGVADALAAKPSTPEALARQVGAEPHALARALRAATSLGLVTRDAQNVHTLTPLGETLRTDVPGSMRNMAIAQSAPGHWLPWGRFSDAVRTGAGRHPLRWETRIFVYYGKHAKEAAAFGGAMANLSGLVSSEVARVLDCRNASRVVDVGGATGVLVAALLMANPHLSGTLFELSHAVSEAKQALETAGLATRCDVVAGDFMTQVPEGDLYVLKHILHDWNDEQAKTILRNCVRAMRPGGRVAIVEMVIPDDGQPSPAELMDLNMLVMLPGQERTRREYEALLADSGLRFERLTETHSPFQIIEAVRATT